VKEGIWRFIWSKQHQLYVVFSAAHDDCVQMNGWTA